MVPVWVLASAPKERVAMNQRRQRLANTTRAPALASAYCTSPENVYVLFLEDADSQMFKARPSLFMLIKLKTEDCLQNPRLIQLYPIVLDFPSKSSIHSNEFNRKSWYVHIIVSVTLLRLGDGKRETP